MLMALGGFTAIADRRYRMALRRKAATLVPGAAPGVA
jgi:hypothetical protein